MNVYETDITPGQIRDQLDRVNTKLSFLAAAIKQHDFGRKIEFDGQDLEGFANILADCNEVVGDAIAVVQDVMNGRYDNGAEKQ